MSLLAITPAAQFRELRESTGTKEQLKLLKDVVRWRYGQKAHLESSLEALKLWDEENPPQLQSIAEYDHGGRYALEMVFALGDVPVSIGMRRPLAWVASLGLAWRRAWRMGRLISSPCNCVSHVPRASHVDTGCSAG